MATYEKYSDKYNFSADVGYSGQSRAYRAKLFLSTTETDEYVKIRYIAVTQMQYAYDYGVGIQISGSDITTEKVTGYGEESAWEESALGNGLYDWYNTTARTSDKTVTIYKTSSAQTATFTAKAYPVALSGHQAAGSTSSSKSVSYSITIPAKPVTSYNVTATAYTGGSIDSGYSSQVVEEGGSCYVYYTPDTGYQYASHSKGGTCSLTHQSTYSRFYFSNVQSNSTVSIYFTKKTYAISYDLNGGDGGLPSGQTKTHGTALTLSTTKPYRYSESAYDGYDVSFNYNGGSGSSSTLTAADYYAYSFSHWNTNSSGTGTSYVSGASYTTNAAVTLYAQWTPTYVEGSVTLPTPNSRTGYTFDGWYTSSALTTKAGNAGASYTPSSNITLYAKWTGNSYTVTYDGNGATSGYMSKSNHVYGTSSALNANQFVRSGYKFLGWSTSSTATTATYTDGQSVSTLTSTSGGNVTLYAVWEQSGNTIHVYDSSGVLHVGLVSAYDSSGVRHDVIISAYDSSGAKHNVS